MAKTKVAAKAKRHATARTTKRAAPKPAPKRAAAKRAAPKPAAKRAAAKPAAKPAPKAAKRAATKPAAKPAPKAAKPAPKAAKRAATKPAAKPAPKPAETSERAANAAALAPVYEALCGWFGAAEIDPIVAATDTDTSSSYLLIRRLAGKLPTLTARLAPAAADNVLAYLLDPANDRAIEYHHDLDDDPADWGSVKPIYPENYCDEGRAVFEAESYPRLITLRDKAVIVAEGINGEGNVWEIDASKAIDHGSVPELLADLRARIA